jgi:ATP-dependent exoDNAse (exonuclease V) alpha subunit
MKFTVKRPTPEQELKTDVREALAGNQAVDSQLVDKKPPVESVPNDHIEGKGKLSRLIEDDFPFDESQLEAINGMANQMYACMTGAAGTGKTTSVKKLVDTLLDSTDLKSVNMATYWKAEDPEAESQPVDSFVPSVALVGFTGRSTQMIKKNFPKDWHNNIMTIHRLLGFYPVYPEKWNEELQQFKKTMQFVPAFDSDNKMPWDIIIIDEAGMLGLDLWHQLWAAIKDGCRVYMVGDINQLPPVHGRSVFGFAMAKWPSWELNHIHRQQGKDNPIVDNAWRILKGIQPKSGGKFQMLELKGDAIMSNRMVRALVPKFQERGVYEPNRDSIITPINGEEGSRGWPLGQLPLNREFSLVFNPKSQNPRYIIDGGREKKHFAVGDKVMATRNDYEAGITNGMTGIIKSITQNAGYGGDSRRWGIIEEVNKYFAEEQVEDDVDFTLEELEARVDALGKAKEDAKEKAERGPASHIVTVEFGIDEYSFEIPFATLAEVGSLMTAYVVTCHKMQGGESPTIVIICHDAHKQMLNREWLYTAVTRASGTCILLYTQTALRTALSKQTIRGSTLKAKVECFNALADPNGLFGASVKVKLPLACRVDGAEEPTPVESNLPAVIEPTPVAVAVESSKPKPEITERVIIVERTTYVPVPVAPVATDDSVIDAEWHEVEDAPVLESKIKQDYLDYDSYNPHKWDIKERARQHDTQMDLGAAKVEPSNDSPTATEPADSVVPIKTGIDFSKLRSLSAPTPKLNNFFKTKIQS